METIAFFDARSYDRTWFDPLLRRAGFEPRYLETRLGADTAILARGTRAVCLFVNDAADGEVLKSLSAMGVEAVALRCAGYNNVDLKVADELNIAVMRVPAYSPTSVAQHAMAMLLTLARKTHRAFVRTRERNFSLEGLCGVDLTGRTAGIIGTGKVGQAFAVMCRGMGMRVIAYDPYRVPGTGIEYVELDELFAGSDVISLHCPLTPGTYHLLDSNSFEHLRDGVMIVNTSRGALIDSEALLRAVKDGKVGAAGLDVYEEEADYFYEDVSLKVMRDDTLNLLLSQPNVLVTSHQAYLTDEALRAIAATTVDNLVRYFSGEPAANRLHHRAEETVH